MRVVARFFAFVCCAIALLVSVPCRADDDAGAPAPLAITPPKAIDAGSVPYPDGAKGEADVIVELVIDTTGAVKQAKIVDGPEPFAGAVLVAADKFTFEPARRGDLPITARIRMKVTFHPPVIIPPPDDAGAADAGATRDGAAPKAVSVAKIEEEIEDVTVFGKRKEVGQLSLGGAEVRQIPGAFGDAFRALEALPGVTPIASGLPFFFVRGAPPGNTGYFIDGVRVPLLYHLAVGPSVIHPGLIDHVDFFPGGYPARFGRFAGGILSGETVGPADKFKMEGNIRIFDAGALAQMPFGPGNRGEALVAGRIGYPGLLLSLFAPDTRVNYWDYQGRFGYRVTDRDTISLFAFGSFDEILQRERSGIYDGNRRIGENVGEFYPLFRTSFHRFDLRWDHRIGNTGNVRTAFTIGFDNSLAGEKSAKSEVIAQIVAGRTEFEDRLSSNVKLRAGADVWYSSYHVEAGGQVAGGSDEARSFPTKTDVNFGVRADLIWRVHPKIEIVPGVRIDYFSTRPELAIGPFKSAGAAGTIAVDPRAASRITITKNLALLTTFGVAHQPPSTAIPIPGLDIGTLADGLQSSLQASQGIELKLPLDFTLTATAFVQNYFNLTDQFSTCITVSGDRAESCITDRVRGRGFGGELLIRRELTKRITGWISYTLSRSTRGTNGIIQANVPGCDGVNCDFSASRQGEVLSEFDRTHVFNLVGAVDLGSGWRFGARFYVYSGRPYTSFHIGGVPLPPYNVDRLPPFWRIDLRVEKQWKIGDRGRISFVVEGLNVTFNREAFAATCPNGDGTPRLQSCDQYQYLGPVAIPSIGVEGSY